MLLLGACSHDSVTFSNDDYNLSPLSRTLAPVAVQRIHGGVSSSDQILSGGTTTIKGMGSYIVLDFGKEVGGITSLQFGAASDSAQSVFLAFSESVLYTGPQSDLSVGGHPDGSLSANVTANGTYTVPPEHLRGGFRYLDGRPEDTGVSFLSKKHERYLDSSTSRWFSFWVGRLSCGYSFVMVANCSSERVDVDFKTYQVTPSVQGGVVSEPR